VFRRLAAGTVHVRPVPGIRTGRWRDRRVVHRQHRVQQPVRHGHRRAGRLVRPPCAVRRLRRPVRGVLRDETIGQLRRADRRLRAGRHELVHPVFGVRLVVHERARQPPQVAQRMAVRNVRQGHVHLRRARHTGRPLCAPVGRRVPARARRPVRRGRPVLGGHQRVRRRVPTRTLHARR